MLTLFFKKKQMIVSSLFKLLQGQGLVMVDTLDIGLLDFEEKEKLGGWTPINL